MSIKNLELNKNIKMDLLLIFSLSLLIIYVWYFSSLSTSDVIYSVQGGGEADMANPKMIGKDPLMISSWGLNQQERNLTATLKNKI